jgi:folate-dependent tRNA-U54 methylase TrmFO/GidA
MILVRVSSGDDQGSNVCSFISLHVGCLPPWLMGSLGQREARFGPMKPLRLGYTDNTYYGIPRTDIEFQRNLRAISLAINTMLSQIS